jgi:hypothetical protein
MKTLRLLLLIGATLNSMAGQNTGGVLRVPRRGVLFCRPFDSISREQANDVLARRT